jgi:glycosyltransferase involved in cell wall biosynthesis
LSFLEQSKRKALELSGERLRLDSTAPTRYVRGYDRIPAIYGDEKDRANVEPDSVADFRLDNIYFCSQTLKQLSEKVGFCLTHAAVIYPGITAAYIGDVKPAKVPVKKFLVVSRLTEESGVRTALKALKIVRSARLDVSLSVYGRGDTSYVADLRSYAVANHLPVDFLNVSNQLTDLAAVYKKHDALLHTPEWQEPFPFTALEAMGCGLPVIGSRSGGMEELLRHGENALTYPAGNEQELAARIQELLLSPALRFQMAELAQSEVLEKFNEVTVMDQIESFLLSSQKAPSENPNVES